MIDPEYGFVDEHSDGTWSYYTDLVFGDGDLENVAYKSKEEQITDWINKVASESGTVVEIETLDGPGGGWPAVTFKGDHDHIDALIRRLAGEAPVWSA